jgi:hypothetical protein
MPHAGLMVSPAYAGSVSFGEPSNGASVSSPVHLSLQVAGKTVRPAGEAQTAGCSSSRQHHPYPSSC